MHSGCACITVWCVHVIERGGFLTNYARETVMTTRHAHLASTEVIMSNWTSCMQELKKVLSTPACIQIPNDCTGIYTEHGSIPAVLYRKVYLIHR